MPGWSRGRRSPTNDCGARSGPRLLLTVCFATADLGAGRDLRRFRPSGGGGAANALSHARMTVRGPDIFDGFTPIRFKGIALTCTEYMTKDGMDDPAKDQYPGDWAYNYCFGGPPSKEASAKSEVELNKEPDNLLKYLLPDTQGGTFLTKPKVKKVSLQSPYNETVPEHVPEVRPITRIAMTGSLYLHECHPKTYRNIIDKMVHKFTSNGVAVILDLHWNCPDTTTIKGCTGAQAPMALKKYGSLPGSVAFWDALSKKYADNQLVFYELYNEPWIDKFDVWYSGDDEYAGMKDMYDTIRRNDPHGIIVIGGKAQYALDPQSGIAFFLQYKKDTGRHPTNIVWNIHPYVGGAQGLEHSLPNALRFALALRTIGPVIFTEFGQYCCGGTGNSCKTEHAICSNKEQGSHFVHNIVNMAEQYDFSWIGWAWRGSNRNNANRPCKDGYAECGQPDIRDADSSGQVTLTDGRRGGANWKTTWETYVSPADGHIIVQDIASKNTGDKDPQPAGFLPRPCLIKRLGVGNVCGWDGGTDVASLDPESFTTQSIYTSILPGFPGSCKSQGCPGQECDDYMGPCHEDSFGANSGTSLSPSQTAVPPVFDPTSLAPPLQMEGLTAQDDSTGPCAQAYEQCGGQEWTGATCCVDQNTCTQLGGDYYSQCVPSSGLPAQQVTAQIVDDVAAASFRVLPPVSSRPLLPPPSTKTRLPSHPVPGTGGAPHVAEQTQAQLPTQPPASASPVAETPEEARDRIVAQRAAAADAERQRQEQIQQAAQIERQRLQSDAERQKKALAENLARVEEMRRKVSTERGAATPNQAKVASMRNKVTQARAGIMPTAAPVASQARSGVVLYPTVGPASARTGVPAPPTGAILSVPVAGAQSSIPAGAAALPQQAMVGRPAQGVAPPAAGAATVGALAANPRQQGPCARAYQQCGGSAWSGPTCCEEGTTCTAGDGHSGSFYRQCAATAGGRGLAGQVRLQEANARAQTLWPSGRSVIMKISMAVAATGSLMALTAAWAAARRLRSQARYCTAVDEELWLQGAE